MRQVDPRELMELYQTQPITLAEARALLKEFTLLEAENVMFYARWHGLDHREVVARVRARAVGS